MRGKHAAKLLRVVALDLFERAVDPLADVRLVAAAQRATSQRAASGTQKTFSRDVLVAVLEDLRALVLVVGVELAAPRLVVSASRCARRRSKESEMYFRKSSPRTRCLYSADSTLPRSRSAASNNVRSKPRSDRFSSLSVAIVQSSSSSLHYGQDHDRSKMSSTNNRLVVTPDFDHASQGPLAESLSTPGRFDRRSPAATLRCRQTYWAPPRGSRSLHQTARRR